MLKKRIIPCLDIQNGRTVKGVNFLGIKDAGDPIELARRYADEEADELVFLDITATIENRKTLVELVEKVAEEIDIPFTVGGGINTVEDAKRIIDAGADKISINSSAVKNPNLISALANELGSQCVVLAIDAKFDHGFWQVFTGGGRYETGLEVGNWAAEGVALGAGEILLTSMNNDGMKSGFALELTNEVSKVVNVPIIASGGAGSIEDFEDLFSKTLATGGLAASIFHYKEVDIVELKKALRLKNIAVRL